MSKAFLILGLFFMLATLFVAGTGIALMATGGEANKKYGTKLMAARVYLQGLALGCILASFSMAGE
jgi:Hypoxia induced protein conserved region